MKTYFIYNKMTNERISFEKEVRLGRSSSCDIQIKEQQVSSNHALIYVKPDGVYLVDTNSANGTMLNGNRLIPKEEMELSERDIIQVGDTILIFNSEEAKMDYVDLPDMTSTFQINSGSLNEIIHEKFAPLSKNDEAGKYSLKNLRKSKDKINAIKHKIEEFEQSKEDHRNIISYCELKKKELEEFDEEFQHRKFKTISEIQNAIDSVALINEKIENEMKEIKEEISDKEKDIALLQEEIRRVQGEMKDLADKYNVDRSEMVKNLKVISQYRADLEDVDGRSDLVVEIKDLENRIKTYEEVDIDQQIEQLKASLLKEEDDLKKVQQTYAKKRFGARSMKLGKTMTTTMAIEISKKSKKVS